MARKKPETNGVHVEEPPPEPEPPPNEREPEPNRPAQVIRYGPVRACIWANMDGDRVWYQVTVNRLFKGADDGQWHSTDSFGYAQLLALSKAIDSAHTWIAERFATEDVPF